MIQDVFRSHPQTFLLHSLGAEMIVLRKGLFTEQHLLSTSALLYVFRPSLYLLHPFAACFHDTIALKRAGDKLKVVSVFCSDLHVWTCSLQLPTAP